MYEIFDGNEVLLRSVDNVLDLLRSRFKIVWSCTSRLANGHLCYFRNSCPDWFVFRAGTIVKLGHIPVISTGDSVCNFIGDT
jgi:hypothetical protein